MQSLDARYKVTPSIVQQTCTQTTIASATATAVTGSKVTIQPREAGDGLTFRFRCSGTKTGTNAAHVISLYINSTAVCALTADDATAVDWVAEFTLVFVNVAAQKVMGTISSDTTDCGADYAAGTVDCSAGATIQLYGTSHASDSLTIELVTVERWDFSPMATS